MCALGGGLPATGARRSRSVADRCPGIHRQNLREARSQRPAHFIMIAQQVARGEDQIVEIEQGRRTLMSRNRCRNGLHLGDQVKPRRDWRHSGAAPARLGSKPRSARRPRCSGARRRSLLSLRAWLHRPISPFFLVGEERAGFVQRSGCGGDSSILTSPTGVSIAGPTTSDPAIPVKRSAKFAVSSFDGKGALRMNSKRTRRPCVANASRCVRVG